MPNLAIFVPALPRSPCRALFGTVTKFERLLRKLLVIVLMPLGNFL